MIKKAPETDLFFLFFQINTKFNVSFLFFFFSYILKPIFILGFLTNIFIFYDQTLGELYRRIVWLILFRRKGIECLFFFLRKIWLHGLSIFFQGCSKITTGSVIFKGGQRSMNSLKFWYKKKITFFLCFVYNITLRP